jgi:DNA-binding beta-propeller fold protein YncE
LYLYFSTKPKNLRGEIKMLSRNRNTKIITLTGIVCLLAASIASVAVAAYNGECWVVNGSGNGEIVKVSPDGQIDPNIISGFVQPQYAVVNPKNGTLWVSDAAASAVFKFNFDGGEPVQIKFTSTQKPRSISIDPNDDSAWVGTDKGVFKVTSDGQKRQVASTGDECYVSVNTSDGSCWGADSSGQVIKLSKDGATMVKTPITGMTEPKYVAVNPTTGNVWVADSQAGIIVKLDANGKELLRTTDVGMPVSLSVDFKTGDLWAADTKNFQFVKLSDAGKVSVTVPDLGIPKAVSVNSKTGEAWVATTQFTGEGYVVKLAKGGKPLFMIDVFTSPISVSVGYWEEK